MSIGGPHEVLPPHGIDNKRNELSPEQIDDLTRIHGAFD